MTDYLPVSTDPNAALKPRKFRQGAAPASDIDSSWFKVASGSGSGAVAGEAPQRDASASVSSSTLSRFLAYFFL